MNVPDDSWLLLLLITERLQSRTFQTLDDEMRETLSGFTARQHAILRKVHMLSQVHPEGISLKDLAECLRLSPATVSSAVEGLVRKNMLERTRCESDRRSVRIRLGRTGEELIRIGCRKIAENAAVFLDTLTGKEKESFQDLLSRFYLCLTEGELQ